MFELQAYISVIARKTTWQLESRLLVVMEVFQNNHFYHLSFNHHYIFLCKNAQQFLCCMFLQLWAFLLMFVTILARNHMEISCFFFKYTCLKEHISAFEKIQPFGHQVILPLKCICRKNLNFENCIFLCDFEAWPQAMPMRSLFFFFFHYNFITKTQKP